jgi:nucleotide-binding universal stress UspA family protein
MFKTIVVGMDCDRESQVAFHDALALAKATGAKLKLVHVFSFDEQCELWWLSPLREQRPDYKLTDYLLDRWQAFLQRQEGVLGECQAQAQAVGVSAVLDLEPYSGRPGAVLCEIARQWPADLIAVGHHDKIQGKLREMGELRLGSVSAHVLHHAPCSVLIDHRVEDAASESLAPLRHILAAIDTSELSQPVFGHALDLAKATGAELTLLHVRSSSFEGDRPAEMMNAFQTDAKAIGVTTHTEEHPAKFGETVGRNLCRYATEHAIDLIVVGRYGLSGLPELLLGSVSHYVSYHAPCAVLVVQPPEYLRRSEIIVI